MQKGFDYPDSVKSYMKSYYAQLPERQRRHYAAIEAVKLGWGGKTYICNLLSVTQKTLRKGIREINNPEEDAVFGTSRQRKVGGGPKFFFQRTKPC